MSATAAMDARTLLGLGRERRRLWRAREAAPRHAECQVRFGPPGRARPRRQSQSEGASANHTEVPVIVRPDTPDASAGTYDLITFQLRIRPAHYVVCEQPP